VRSFCSILLNLGLLLASLEAPFLHTHQHEATQRHPGAFFHLHVRSAHAVSAGHEFRTLDPDEDAQYQAWFSATPTNSVSIPAVILAEPFSLPLPERNRGSVEAPLQIGHDPPLLVLKSPRAPPV
jgi:hypothetical protein